MLGLCSTRTAAKACTPTCPWGRLSPPPRGHLRSGSTQACPSSTRCSLAGFSWVERRARGLIEWWLHRRSSSSLCSCMSGVTNAGVQGQCSAATQHLVSKQQWPATNCCNLTHWFMMLVDQVVCYCITLCGMVLVARNTMHARVFSPGGFEASI